MTSDRDKESARFEIVEPDTAIYAEIARRFDAFNREHTNWDWTAFSVVHHVRNEVVAAARGVTNMGLVEIRGFWVDPDLRGNGLGTNLMNALESEAVRRGCTRAALDTYSWQAFDFYTRLGFTCFGKLDYPNGTARYYLTKDLIA